MDPALLKFYNEELAHLREVGAEFAREFPKIAARLSMEGIEVADPYVERLLEGFAFMAARTRIKLEAEYPQFIQHLLETVYPNFISPVPSMAVLRLAPNLLDPNLIKGPAVPRHSTVLSETSRGQGTRCEFRTAHEVRVWPLEIVSAQYFSHAPDLPMAELPVARQVKGGLRIRLKLHGGLRFGQLPLDELQLYISAADDTALRLHELIHTAALGSWVTIGSGRSCGQWRSGDSVSASGFDDDQALLPETLRGFSGHRLLQEYAALPQRLLFFEVSQLRARLAHVQADEVDLVILFSRADPALEALIDTGTLLLFCTPAINLFSKRLDRVQTSAGRSEYHVVADRARPMDFEVHSIESVTGYGNGPTVSQEFRPLYAAFHAQDAARSACYTTRREPRLLSQRQQQQGPRSSYVGCELFMALVDPQHAPYGEDVRQLSIRALVTNRDLPLLLPSGNGASAKGGWALDMPGPVKTVVCVRGPTRPTQRLPRGDIGWSLISLLNLNYLSIAGEDEQRAAAALRSLLALYGPPEDPAWLKQVEGVQAVRARTSTRRLPFAGPLTFGSGVTVELDVDELGFQGASAVLLGSVLERFLARHAAINSYTETHLRSLSRGLLMRWPPRCGNAALL